MLFCRELPLVGSLKVPMSRAVDVVPYETLQQPLSPFFLDYLAGRERVAPFLRPGRIRARRDRGRRHGGGSGSATAAVAEALARQQEARGSAQAAAARAARSRRRERPPIVTGQQAGLFGGPLFVLWKALATVVVARQLEAERGKPVVPVFWVASDDHDFAEVRGDDGGRRRGSAADAALRPARGAARAARPGTSRSTRRSAVSSTSWRGRCPPRSGATRRSSSSRPAIAPARRLSSAFARLVSRLLPELVVLDPADAELKRLVGAGAGARARRRLAELEAGARGRPGAARGRLPSAGAGAARLPEPVRGRGRPAPRARDRERHGRGARHARALAARRGAAARSRATRARGARARCCGRWCRTRCCRPPPTSPVRPRSRTTRRSDRPTRTSASRARCCCRGRA